MYNMEDNFTLPSVEEPADNGTTEAHVVFPLRDPMPPETYFYYQVLAFDEDQHVLVLGNFTTGNYSDGEYRSLSITAVILCIEHNGICIVTVIGICYWDNFLPCE